MSDDKPEQISLTGDYKPFERQLIELGVTGDAIGQFRDFVNRSGERGQLIASRFQLLLDTPPDERLTKADQELGDVMRQGWLERGYEMHSSIREHSIGLARIIKQYQAEGMPEDTTRMQHMARYHDIAEAIITDFTPKEKELYGLDDALKHTLETMALAVIFESPLHHGVCALVEAYEGRACEDAKLTSDIDKCYAVMEAIDIDRRYGDAAEPFFNEVSQQLRESNKLSTDVGEALMKKLENPKERCAVMAQFDLANIQLRDPLGPQAVSR
jgi:5'-deoxynucleotidase YfbR-like HD superfamily hydrolase